MKNEFPHIPKQQELFQVPEGYWDALPARIEKRAAEMKPEGRKISWKWMVGISSAAAACLVIGLFLLPAPNSPSSGELAEGKRNMQVPVKQVIPPVTTDSSTPVVYNSGVEKMSVPVTWEELLEEEELDYVMEVAVLMEVVPVSDESLMEDMWSDPDNEFEMFGEI